MPATWAKGENAPLAGSRFRVSVRSAEPVDVSVLLLASSGRVRSDADFVFYNQPDGDGVALRHIADGRQVIEVDLDAIDARRTVAATGASADRQSADRQSADRQSADRLIVVASLDDDAKTFGTVSQPTVQLDRFDGIPIGMFAMAGLATERAVIALEIYRRAGAWKVRAVGQGYDGGLAELVAAHGVVVEPAPAPAPEPAPAPAPESATQRSGTPVSEGQRPAVPAGLPIRFTPGHHAPYEQPVADGQERLYDQFWGIFEDAARSAAAFESASAFARQRLEQELSDVVADQTTRHSPQAAIARSEAQRRHDELLARAGADHLRDTAHLRAELAELSGSLPAPMASWDDPAWARFAPPRRLAAGIRVGTLHRASGEGPVVPFILRLPLARPLWIDASGDGGPAAEVLAKSVLARALAGHPSGTMTVSVIDLIGNGAALRLIGPLLQAGSRVLPMGPREIGAGSRPVASVIGSVTVLGEFLADLVARVDMARMAARAGVTDALAAPLTQGAHLLVWYGFPIGLDERGMNSVRFLMEEGPAAGVFLVLVSDATDATEPTAGGHHAESVLNSTLRLAATPAACVGDPWVGLLWIYTPDHPGAGAPIDRVLTRIAQSRR